MSRFSVDFRLILLDPQNFGCSEACQCIVAGNLDQPVFAQPLADIVALFASALIVPQDGGTQHVP